MDILLDMELSNLIRYAITGRFLTVDRRITTGIRAFLSILPVL